MKTSSAVYARAVAFNPAFPANGRSGFERLDHTPAMARPNYSGEKRRKELEKQKKKEAKKQRKLENASSPKEDDAATEGGEPIAIPSPS